MPHLVQYSESFGFLFPHLGQYSGVFFFGLASFALSNSVLTSSETCFSPFFAVSTASSRSLVAFCTAYSRSFSQSGLLSTGVLTLSFSPFSVLKPQFGQKFTSSVNSFPHDLHTSMIGYYASDIKNVLVIEIKLNTKQ